MAKRFEIICDICGAECSNDYVSFTAMRSCNAGYEAQWHRQYVDLCISCYEAGVGSQLMKGAWEDEPESEGR